MGRIRSIHPGQWTDEDFVELSFPARLLAIGLRNEADDNGVFEWKPTGLRMRLFPADAIDLPKLLEELIGTNHIARFEVDGRNFGAIRNFRTYQSPKSPTSQYPVTDDILVYVGLSRSDGAPARRGPGRPPKSILQNGEINSDDPNYLSENTQTKGDGSPDDEGHPRGRPVAKAPKAADGDASDRARKTDAAQSHSINEIPKSGELINDKTKSFPQKMENNSLMERRGEERNKESPLPPVDSEALVQKALGVEFEKPKSPALEAVMDAAGMTIIPDDWHAMFDKWKEAGADLNDHVIPAVHALAAQQSERGGRRPFKLKFFDSAVLEKVDADARQVQVWKDSRARDAENQRRNEIEDEKSREKIRELITEFEADGRNADHLHRELKELG